MHLGATRLPWAGGAGAERGGAKRLTIFISTFSIPRLLSAYALQSLLLILFSFFGETQKRMFPASFSGSILTSSRHAIATRARRAENSAEFTASRRFIYHLFIYDFEMNE